MLNPVDGTQRARIVAGNLGNDRAWAVAGYKGDTMILSGEFSGTVPFSDPKTTSAGASDGFVWRTTAKNK